MGIAGRRRMPLGCFVTLSGIVWVHVKGRWKKVHNGAPGTRDLRHQEIPIPSAGHRYTGT